MQQHNSNSKENMERLEKALEAVRKNFIYSLRPTKIISQTDFLLFRPINLHTLTTLSENALWFSHPSTFNDPFDSNLIKKTYKGKIDCSQVLRELRVRSLSVYNPNNMLLWSHYADGHKGIAIKIKLDQNLLLKNNIILRKISYNQGAKLNHGYVVPHVWAEEAYLRKDSVWEYEKEYRLITLSKYLTKDHLLISNMERPFFQIEQIIFGFKTAQENKSIIKKLLPKVSYVDITKEELKRFTL